MRAFNGILQKLLIVVLTVGLLSACGGKEERKAKYLEKGKAYLAEENYDKANIEFKNVLQIDPKDADGYYYLGLVQEKKQDWARAFSSYEKAIELDPDQVDARVHVARFYLARASAPAVRENKEALANVLGLLQEQLNEIQSRDPDNLERLTLEATLWVNDGETDKALEQLERVVKKDPGNRTAVVLLSSLYERAERKDEAEQIIENAIATGGSDKVVFRKRLSQIYSRSGKNDKAEGLLRDIVADNPDDLGSRLDLASFLARSEQLDKAEQVLREAIAAEPDDAQRYLLMTEFLATKRDRQTAVDELARAATEKPKLTELSFVLVKLYLANEQQDEAEQLLKDIIEAQGTEPAGLQARVLLAQLLATADVEDKRVSVLVAEVLEENPQDNGALLIKGKLAAYKKDYVGAIGDFRSVLKDQPESEEVLLLLSSAHLANGESELAVDTLMRGIESNPAARLRLRLSKLLEQQGDIDNALKQINLVLEEDSKNTQALKAKYELLARRGDAQGVEEVARLMQEAEPEKETGYMSEARLRFAQKDYDAANTLLDKALEKNPDSIPAVLAKMDVLAAQKKYDEAIALTERLLVISPGIAEAYYRKGTLLQAQDKLQDATKQYELALEKAPDSSEVLSALVGLEVKQGKKPEAEQRLLGVLEKNPQHDSANELLGILYASNKDYVKAEKAFERQIAIRPGRVSLYIQLSQSRRSQDDMEGAVGALQQGLYELPGDSSLLLAMAGLREYQKDFEAAIAIYEQVLELKPGDAIAVNNLAALLSDHRSDPESLDKALELAALLESRDEAPFLDTAGWVFYRKGDYEKAVKVLKKAVDSKPDISVFQYHLGMAYFGLGNKAAASEHLTRATTGNDNYTGIEEARATLKKL